MMMTINTTALSPSSEIKDSATASTFKVCSKELTTTLPKRQLDHFSISIVQECTAIKKGLLWEQQQTRFFFNRWKERFFILTQDYLTCFKKGSKKVGMSEMGSFVYKINLNEIKNLNWVDKKKNGVIGVQLANTMIFLWNNVDTVLDEWMSVLQDSTIRTKDRRSEASIRKSSTLLPNMLHSSNVNGSNDDKFTKTEMIQRNDSPSVILKSSANSNNKLINEIIIPPPPPPRRYLRCLSTDLGTMNTHSDTKVVMTPSLSRNSMAIHNSPIMVNNNNKTIWTKTNSDIVKAKDSTTIVARKPSDTSSTASSSLMSQSLRCKSSYALQYSPLMVNNNNSPTQMNQQQRRITAKRISTFQQQNNHHPIQNMMKNNYQTSSSSTSSFFQSADSEFTFVNSKATTFKPDSIFARGYKTTTTHNNNSRDSPTNINYGSRANRISSSASLMLNHRRKDRFILQTPTPPPVPPHRTHLHNF
ncbi:hypothetical protein HUG17_1330 [Dermatophagoides farinae]|uniref:PH domain-containing protein n=1 Tax=Dermatophagoides farinae TaxID=6954 RepID=A0A9D4P8B3_DERFA|nr:hypothetical protein HUG17_1330 [Dermatophagoides farinae]